MSEHSTGVTEQDIQRYNTRIGGLAALTLGWALVFITNAQFDGSAPIDYPLHGQLISTGVFVFVFFPLAYYGTKWLVQPGTDRPEADPDAE